MTSESWKTRLRAAIDASGRTPREISLAAGLNERYISQSFTEGKEPKIGPFIKVCEALGVSPAYILSGVSITPEGEALLRVWSEADHGHRQAILTILSRE